METEASKYRYFAFLVYRTDKYGHELITQDELEIGLSKSFGEFAISPLHEPDEDDECEHWHVVYRHPGPIVLKGACKIIRQISYDAQIHVHNDYVLALHHPKVYQRYLVHLDNPEKQQFEGGANSITVVNGFPLDVTRELSIPEQLQIQMEIESFARDYNIFEYASMTTYLAKHAMFEHYRYFTTHTHHFGKFLDSLRYSAEQNQEVDLDTQ